MIYSQALQQFARLLAEESLSLEKQISILGALSELAPNSGFLADCVYLLKDYGNLFELPSHCVDIVGTGGDGLNTFNISTLSAIFLAKMGVKVVKHGNRSSSSACGSMDLLQQLKIIPAKTAEEVSANLANKNLAFLSALDFYPVLVRLRPARQALVQKGHKTLFHLLGPLAHPGQIKRQVIGVYHPALLESMAGALQKLGTEFAVVIHGNGADEWTLSDENLLYKVSAAGIRRMTYSCSNFGFKPVPNSELQGGTPKENAVIAKAVLSGKGTVAQNQAIQLNAALGFYVAHHGEIALEDCVKEVIHAF